MSWYRTYRPQRVVDLEIAPIREHFLQVLKSGQFGHAYLFAGPRGTGKTSTARILARVLNDPANAENVLAGQGPLHEPSADDALLQRIAQGRAQVVIEQDAASHRGIDDIRQLQEEVSIIPAEGTIRVVILDEVHMLTAEAFNALLKLLEEPPARVVFILATTELHKVPATIQSRCQLLRFRLATHDELESVLQKVIKAEKLKVDPEALQSLIMAANGSFRDGVKYLEQVAVNPHVTAESVASILGSTQALQNLLKGLAQKDIGGVQSVFAELRASGASFSALETSLLQALHDRLTRALSRQEPAATVQNILALLEFLVSRLGGGPEPYDGLRLEVACYRWVMGNESQAPSNPTTGTDTASPKKAKTPPAQALQREEPEAQISQGVEAQHLDLTENRVKAAWESILLSMRTQNTAVEALLRTAQVGTVTPTSIEIVVARPFHYDRLITPKYQNLVKTILEQHLGPLELSLRLKDQDPNEFTPVDTTPDDFANVVDALVMGM